jgi:hypothetical protein
MRDARKTLLKEKCSGVRNEFVGNTEGLAGSLGLG